MSNGFGTPAAAVGLQVLLTGTSPLAGVIVRAACNAVGILYPVYNSFKSIETNRPDPAQLTYWSIYGLASIIEGLFDQGMRWMPWYYHAKLLFLVWLQAPSCQVCSVHVPKHTSIAYATQGARRLYNHLLKPLLLQHQRDIEEFLSKCKAMMSAGESSAVIDTMRSILISVPFLRYVFAADYRGDNSNGRQNGAH